MNRKTDTSNLFKLLTYLIFLYFGLSAVIGSAQTLPGDTLVHGPMFSPVYNNSVRVWVLTEDRGTGTSLQLELKSTGAFSNPLVGQEYQSDSRLGYNLRTYLFTGLATGQTYTANILTNGKTIVRSASIKNENEIVDDFSFLSGGCARIYDLSRCIDRPESQTHKNGDPEIFNRMANENADMMIWLGDATYLLGLQHAMGQCPDAIDDWANKDTAFSRYMFYRQFHDKLIQAMPQLAITDNHDTGPNEWNKHLPSLPQMKEIFMEWWPNPEYHSTSEGQGLFSSYRYKDVEYFLIDNRSFRDDTKHHLGPDQFEWLKQSLKNSDASFKILVNATPSFAKHWGGRNFSVTEQGDELVDFIQDNNIDGVLSLSADIHSQEFYGRYGGVKYPLYDVLSGNLNSDVGNGDIRIDYNSDRILRGTKQTYLKISVYGPENNRRLKVAYTGLDGTPYFSSIIHQDMLTSQAQMVKKLDLPFTNSMQDESSNHFLVNGNISFGKDRNGEESSAANFNNSELSVWSSSNITLNDRAFTIGFWLKPASYNSRIFSNTDPNSTSGFNLGLDNAGKLQYTDPASGIVLTSLSSIAIQEWSHVTWKYDNVKRLLSLYINGVFSQSWSNIVSPTGSNSDILLGRDHSGNYYDGMMDELFIYGKLLQDSNIQDLANYVSKRSNVISMEGSQNLVIPGNQLNPALAENFTIEFWGRLMSDPTTNSKILASNSRVDGNSTGISFEFSDSNKLNVVVGTNSSGWNTLVNVGPIWNIGEWNHVAVSALANNELVYYVNGEKSGSMAFSGYVPNPTGLGLGDSPYYGSEVNAEMDELRVWSRALTQLEIRENMFRNIRIPSSDLSFYYDFNQETSEGIQSRGANPYRIALDGARLAPGSAPVAAMKDNFDYQVGASWSVENDKRNGLYINEPLSNYTSNLIVGKNSGSGYSPLPGTHNMQYLHAGWHLDPSNIPSANLVIDLEKAMSNPHTILDIAQSFMLIKGDPQGDYHVVADGITAGNTIVFNNVTLAQSTDVFLAFTDGTTISAPVKMFQHCHYEGYVVALDEGNYTLAQLQEKGMLNDDASSLQIAEGYEAVLYQHHNFTGNTITLRGNNNCLSDEGFNDEISSVKIRKINNEFSLFTEAENFDDSLGVQIETSTDSGGGQNVGWIDTGDWLAFHDLDFPSSGAYKIEYRVASAAGGGTLSADLNAGDLALGTLSIPDTGGWQNWVTLSHTVNIEQAGSANFGIYATKGGWNINWWRITKLQ